MTTKLDALKCDVLYIDNFIRTSLSEKMSSVDELQRDLTKMMLIALKSPFQKDRDHATEQTKILKKRFQDVAYGFEYGLYLMRTDDVLSEYKKLTQTTKSRSFVTKVQPISPETKLKIARLHIAFLQIANEFVPISNINIVTNNLSSGSTTCSICFGMSFEPQDDGRNVCKDCGAEIEVMEDVATFKDGERVKMAPRYKYTTKGYFIDAMNNIECKQNKDVEPIIPAIVKEMKMQSLNADTVTLQQFYAVILDLKLSDFYNDVYLLFFKVTKKLIFNITSLRNEMIEMHEYISEVYEEIKEDDNAQNVYMKIFKILQLLDYPCTRDQFFYLRDMDNEGKHDKKWRMQMEILAERYPEHTTSNGKPRWRYISS